MQCFDESYQNIHLMKLDVYSEFVKRIKVCHGSNKNLFRNQLYQIIEGNGPCSRTRRYVYHGIYHEYPHDQKDNYMLHDQKLFLPFISPCWPGSPGGPNSESLSRDRDSGSTRRGHGPFRFLEGTEKP